MVTFQIRLRTLFLFTGFCAVLFSVVLAYHSSDAAGDRLLAAALQKYETGEYREAIKTLDRFLWWHPYHEGKSRALVIRAVASILVKLDSPEEALLVAEEQLTPLINQDVFLEVHDEADGLEFLLYHVALGFADKAETARRANNLSEQQRCIGLMERAVNLLSRVPRDEIEGQPSPFSRSPRLQHLTEAIRKVRAQLNESGKTQRIDTRVAD